MQRYDATTGTPIPETAGHRLLDKIQERMDQLAQHHKLDSSFIKEIRLHPTDFVTFVNVIITEFKQYPGNEALQMGGIPTKLCERTPLGEPELVI